MSGVMSLVGYLAAMLASGVFWLGVDQESFLFRAAGAVIATFGIWVADRTARSGNASPAAALNGLLLLVMALISLYLHFTG